MSTHTLGGRFGDRFRLPFFALMFFAVVFGFGALYAVCERLQPGSFLKHTEFLFNSDKPVPLDGLDPFYFSIVTSTTLGYGDIVPIGAGRVIAAIQVTLSLVLGGTLVSQLLDARHRRWDGALRACGTWIERSVRAGGDAIVSEVTIHAVGNSLRMSGESFDDDVTKSLGPFNGELRANDFPTLVFRYEDRTSPATPYTRGFFSLIVAESKGIQTRYDGESVDEKIGLQDQVRGYLITDTTTLRLLADPTTRLAALRELRRNVF